MHKNMLTSNKLKWQKIFINNVLLAQLIINYQSVFKCVPQHAFLKIMNVDRLN